MDHLLAMLDQSRDRDREREQQLLAMNTIGENDNDDGLSLIHSFSMPAGIAPHVGVKIKDFAQAVISRLFPPIDPKQQSATKLKPSAEHTQAACKCLASLAEALHGEMRDLFFATLRLLMLLN